jgi:predicted enzyme related to lactoylglutathione lyase
MMDRRTAIKQLSGAAGVLFLTQPLDAESAPDPPAGITGSKRARVTGIGGVFLRVKDVAAMNAWYAAHLGIAVTSYGANMHWSDDVPKGTGSTAWTLFPEDTKYFGPGTQQAMINYRVDDLDALLVQLQAAGVEIDPKRQNSAYGKFAWIVDPEGNRVELWQPLAHAS